MNQLSSESVHASCVAIGESSVLIEGPSGAGKSDLALRLIDRGATLVSDDQVLVRRAGEQLLATAPDRIAGRIEVRGLGIVELPFVSGVPLALVIQLHDRSPRMPDAGQHRFLLGRTLPVLLIDPREASAPIKVELALRQLTGTR